MLQLASRLFADVDVGKKLFAGFALVLLLTVAVTASGFIAVRAVLQAHERVERLTAVNLHIMQARRLERSFAIEQSAESASRVRDCLQRLNEQLAVSSTQSQRRAVSEMQQAAEEYRQQFDRYVQLQEGARSVRSGGTGHVRRRPRTDQRIQRNARHRPARPGRNGFWPEQAHVRSAWPGKPVHPRRIGRGTEPVVARRRRSAQRRQQYAQLAKRRAEAGDRGRPASSEQLPAVLCQLPAEPRAKPQRRGCNDRAGRRGTGPGGNGANRGKPAHDHHQRARADPARSHGQRRRGARLARRAADLPLDRRPPCDRAWPSPSESPAAI